MIGEYPVIALFLQYMARKTAAHITTLDVRKRLASILVSATSC